MAKILTTKGSAAALEDLIRRATSDLYLISYSFIISDSFTARIKQAADRGVTVHLIYGKSLRCESDIQLETIKKLKIYNLPNLHAKIYLNESKCIIGSMNFSEASEINNTELGVLLSLANDRESFEDAKAHCMDILSMASLEFQEDKNIKPVFGRSDQTGYCIRSGKKIPLDHEKPFCYEAYQEWSFWGNADYAENFCHFTGEKSNGKTSMSNPILKKNWQDYQKIIF